jgi:hypothetical protein
MATIDVYLDPSLTIEQQKLKHETLLNQFLLTEEYVSLNPESAKQDLVFYRENGMVEQFEALQSSMAKLHI